MTQEQFESLLDKSQLSAQEHESLQEAIKHNPDFKEQYAVHLELQQAFKDLSLKNKIRESVIGAEVDKKPSSSNKKWAVMFAFFACMAGLLVVFSKKESQPSSETNKQIISPVQQQPEQINTETPTQTRPPVQTETEQTLTPHSNKVPSTIKKKKENAPPIAGLSSPNETKPQYRDAQTDQKPVSTGILQMKAKKLLRNYKPFSMSETAWSQNNKIINSGTCKFLSDSLSWDQRINSSVCLMEKERYPEANSVLYSLYQQKEPYFDDVQWLLFINFALSGNELMAKSSLETISINENHRFHSMALEVIKG